MRRIGTEERRTRLGVGHHLARPAPDVQTAAADLVGLHASDPVSVYLSLRARVAGFAVPDLEEALYGERTLVRMLGMRRTMFVVPVDLAAVMDAACTRGMAPAERRRLAGEVERQGIAGDGAAWIDRVLAATLEALFARGEATAAELVSDVPALAEKLTFGEGKSWGGTFGMSTRVLFLLATEGRIVRARPLGSWLSSQYRWAPVARWIPGGLPTLRTGAARAELTVRWLRSYGPGTLADLKWWTGWNVRDTKAALSAVGAVEVETDEGSGYLAAEDLEPEGGVGHWAALLPSLDPTVMGWKERGWYLGRHRAHLFDRNGNAGPTAWWNGRVVGGWAQRRTGEIAVRVLEDVGSEAVARIEAEAARLSDWLGDVRINPRFRTPLETELGS